MPMRLTTQFGYQGEYWTNVYWLNGATPAAVETPAAQIKDIVLSHLDSRVTFVNYRIDDAVQDTDVYATYVVNALGGRSNGSNQLLPLYATLVVDMTVNFGRPSRKYFRGILTEGDVGNIGAIEAAVLSAFNTTLAAPLAAIAELVDVDGQDISAGICKPMAGIRQLRRGSKKKITP